MFLSKRDRDSPYATITRYVVAILLMAVGLLALATCGTSGSNPSPTAVATGTVTGKVSIGPLCPVEPCTNPNNPYTGLTVVISDAGAVVRSVDVTDDGSYSANVPAGTYDVDLQPCEWLGCRSSLPERVTVKADQLVTLDISIDTGIR
jgi:hypothetical protein